MHGTPINPKPIEQVNPNRKRDYTLYVLFGLVAISALQFCVFFAQRDQINELRAAKIHTEYVEVVKHDQPPARPCVVPANVNGAATLMDQRDHATLTYNPYSQRYKSDAEWLEDEGKPYIEKLGYRLCPRP